MDGCGRNVRTKTSPSFDFHPDGGRNGKEQSLSFYLLNSATGRRVSQEGQIWEPRGIPIRGRVRLCTKSNYHLHLFKQTRLSIKAAEHYSDSECAISRLSARKTFIASN